MPAHPFRAFTGALMMLMCVLVLAACAGKESVPLTGTITNQYTGQPIPAANISIVPDAAQEPRVRVATDNSGKYQAADWTTKDVLRIDAPGYAPMTIPLGTQAQLAQPTPPAVTLDAKLRPDTLSGVVTDKTSTKPLPGVRVAVTIDSTHTISATTGPDGRYTLSGLPEQFKLSVAAADYESATLDVSRALSQDVALRSNVLSGSVTDRYSGQAVAGAQVVAVSDAGRGPQVTTDTNGRYRLEAVPATTTAVEVSAPGYAKLSQQLGKEGTLDAVLRPDVIKGTLVDKTNGKPITNATIIATTAVPGIAVASVDMANQADGTFNLSGIPESGYVQVLSPGYTKAVLKLEPGSIPAKIELEPFTVKALYITAAVGAAGPKLLDEYLDLIDTTELNTLIIDLKSDLRDDLGTVYYDSQVPIVKQLGTAKDYMDLPAIVAEAKKRGIYTIARVQNFSHDNALADAKPEWAIHDPKTGKVYADYPGPGIRYAWLDAWNRNVWDYNIQLSVEAAQMGFDEINYDYIRYPDGDPETYTSVYQFSQPTDPKNNSDAMYQNLAEYMNQAQKAIHDAGAFFSVDLFGRVVLNPSKVIGQNIALMAPHADYICPMIYPSLWWSGYLDLDSPVSHPYEVVLGSLKSGQQFVEGKRAELRPWIQAYTDPWQTEVVHYGPEEIRAQIKATKDFNPSTGWMLYNSANVYDEGPLEPEKK